MFVSDLQELDSVTQRTVSVLFLVCPRSVLSGCLVDISVLLRRSFWIISLIINCKYVLIPTS